MELQEAVTQVLFHCRYKKNLSPKTLKAYSIDLREFTEYLATNLASPIVSEGLLARLVAVRGRVAHHDVVAFRALPVEA